MVEEQSGEQKSPEQIKKDEYAKSLEKLVPVARRFQKEITELCNRKFKGGAFESAVVATIVLRNIVVSNTRRTYRGDVKGGRDHIDAVYEATKKDALIDWGE